MPEILMFYFGGLTATAVLAVAVYYVLGGSINVFVQGVFGRRQGALWGRSSRILLIVIVLVGGLATEWHGCGGYNDYKAIAADRGLMFAKSTEQVASAMTYAKTFLFVVAGIGAITVAVLARGRHNGTRRDKIIPPPGTRSEGRNAMRR